MAKTFYLFLSLTISFYSFAQLGSIDGVVTDASTKEPIIGANVYIEGTTVGTSTDLDGKFLINNVKPGTYNIVVSFITYRTHIEELVAVEAGKRITLNVEIVEDIAELMEVVVRGTREINNDMALITAIKESKLVVSGISAEQIVRVPDRDAAQIMQRVPGVSIVDNRFVMIRGVSERYNQVMINNVIGPSTEVDKRSFSFDLIPSGSIDQILIYKSGAPEIPGDFAGGVIQVITKQAGDENYFRFGTSLGFRANTTFKDYKQSQGSSTDIFGFDNGFRSLPANFPSTFDLQNSTRTSALRQQAGSSLTNNFGYNTRTAPVDAGMNMELVQNFNIRGVKINTLNNLAYSNAYQFKDVSFNRYLFNPEEIFERFSYDDRYYENDVRISGISNWAVSLNKNNKIEFKNLVNILGENQTILREGIDFFVNVDRDYQNYSYHYLSRFIYSGQLQGTHLLPESGIKIDWVGGYNYVNRNEPDFRRFRTFRVNSLGEEGFQMQLPPSANLFETGRFFSDLTDIGLSNGLNFEKKFGDVDEKRTPALRAGYYVERKERNFNARYVSYLYPGFFDPMVGEQLIRLPINEIFAPENIRTQDGFVIEEGTRPSDTYVGENLLLAGYIGGAIPLGNFDISGGIRLESNRQQIRTADTSGPIEVDNPVISPLPFMNTAYNISDRSLVRLAYSRTINRPEFRELAPFLYYDFELELGVTGNPNLKVATIDNVDLRWETYPNPGETISAGLFYKAFTNPIESILLLTAESPQSTYGNADKGYAYGVELELRKSLASLGVSRFLHNTAVNLNASYIVSEVDLGEQAGFQQRRRPLQGQSPYLYNIGIFYTDEPKGFSASVAYNIFGQRIFQVGDINFPSVFELPRHSLDLQISKRFGKLETRFNIQNLLDAAYRFYQDTDENNKIEIGGRDVPILQYNIGQAFSLGLSYRVSK
ncbi:MAG TPA: carboxypeptidase-like regulatory domain-containing protein [Cyclobacteriaceae bacterium]|nr:carboxypeptidase-like regulatory domain-containing protein [Cyclobacteriaceae bacterium]